MGGERYSVTRAGRESWRTPARCCACGSGEPGSGTAQANCSTEQRLTDGTTRHTYYRVSFPLCENCKSARLRTRLVRFGTAFLFAVPFLPGFVSARTDAAETTAAWWLLGAAIAGFAVGWRIWMLVPRASDMFERGRRANDPAAMRVATPVEIGAAEGPPPEEGYPWVTFSFVDGDYGRDFEQANL